jgi:hypothetical protein
MNDHERIFLQPDCCADPDTGRLWCEDPSPEDCDQGAPWTEYVRRDIFEELLSAAADYIEILELKLRSVSPYGNVMPWDRPKDADIAAAKGRWLAEKAFTEVKGR